MGSLVTFARQRQNFAGLVVASGRAGRPRSDLEIRSQEAEAFRSPHMLISARGATFAPKAAKLLAAFGRTDELQRPDRRDDQEGPVDQPRRQDAARDSLFGNTQRDSDQGEGSPVQENGTRPLRGGSLTRFTPVPTQRPTFATSGRFLLVASWPSTRAGRGVRQRGANSSDQVRSPRPSALLSRKAPPLPRPTVTTSPRQITWPRRAFS